MIDLKRNSKKELVPATGKRTRLSSIYSPNQVGDFKISRGKFSDFLTCRRCFYMDRVVGLDAPGTPGWTLNETTDILLKKEFDSLKESIIEEASRMEKAENIQENESTNTYQDSQIKKALNEIEGINCRLDGIQAAVLSV